MSTASGAPDIARIRQLRVEQHATRAWLLSVESLPATAAAPNGWRLVSRGEDGRAWATANRSMSVIESVAYEDDGRRWHHVSIGRRDRDPTWQELADAKRAFIGDREAYVVLPPQARYVNLHPHVLHLWACLDVGEGQVLPDFARGTRSI